MVGVFSKWQLAYLYQVTGDISASDVETFSDMRQREALIDRANVSDAIARVENDTGDQTLRVEGQDCLNGHMASSESIFLEHDLDELLAILERIHWRLGEQDFAFGRVDIELGRPKRVIPDVLHLFPVPHHAILHGVAKFKFVSQLAGFVSENNVLHSNNKHRQLSKGLACCQRELDLQVRTSIFKQVSGFRRMDKAEVSFSSKFQS